MKQLTVSVSEFRSKCLRMLEELGGKGGTITITKRGQPLAIVHPIRQRPWKSAKGILEGKMTVPEGLEKMDTTDLWECLQPKRRADR